MHREEPGRDAPGGRRRRIGLLLGPLLLIALLSAPLNLDPRAQKIGAIFALVATYWITEAIPLAATALLGPTLAILLGAADARSAYASFGDPIIFLFVGSFLIARAMEIHGLDRRIALFVLSRRWVGESPSRILLAFGATGFLVSMWISNTAAAAMMFPIAAGVLATLDRAREPGGRGADPRRSGSYATGLMLMVAYSCSIGGIATPVGTPPNLIALGFLRSVAGVEVGFLEWMAIAAPIAAACFGVLYLVIRLLFPSAERRLAGARKVVLEERLRLGPWSAGEKSAAAAFSLAVALWTLPGAIAVAAPAEWAWARHLPSIVPEPVAALLGALALFVLPGGRSRGEAAMGWSDAAGIDWGTILLFGGGLAMGSLASETGLAAVLGRAVEVASGIPSLPVLLLAGIVAAAALTEIMSNTATANIVIPLILAMPGASGAGAILPVLGAAIATSLAFCLPVSTPPNAIVYASGKVPLLSMIRAGVLLDVLCALVAWAVLCLRAGNL